jgi:uncharacterized membrane protein
MNHLAVPVAATFTGLTAGVYLAFSVMVMPALGRGSEGAAVTTMQRINDLAVRPMFMIVFFGAAVGSAWVLVGGWGADGGRGGAATAGAVLSLAAFAVTVAFHVPRNRRIARLDPGSSTDVPAWPALSAGWRRGNHLRTVCAGLGLVAFVW